MCAIGKELKEMTGHVFKLFFFFWPKAGFAQSGKVLEFSSTLNVVVWKEFFDAFWLSKTEYKS